MQSNRYKPHYENRQVGEANEAPFEVPESWEWTTIGSIFQHNTGKALNKSDSQEGLLKPYLTTSNVYWNSFDFTEVKEMYFKDSELEKCTVTKGDLLVCEGGDIGRAAIWRYDYEICIQNHIHRLRGIGQVCQILYLYVLMLYKWTDKIHGKGIGLQGLSSGLLDKLMVPLPPYEEQIRIVTAVGKWFALIDTLETTKEDLQESIAQAKSKILDLAIHGKLVPQDPNDEPAIDLLKRINPKFTPCDNAHYENVPFEVPKNWLWLSHNAILDISGGSQPAKSHFISKEEEGYIRLYQIRDYGETPVPVYIPRELASKTTQKGDILLARYGGSLGKVFIAEEGAYNVAMAKVIFKYNGLINKEYAYFYYLSSLYQDKLKSISRTAQAGFNSTDFEDMFFPLPPIAEQERIVTIINQYYRILDNISAEL